MYFIDVTVVVLAGSP